MIHRDEHVHLLLHLIFYHMITCPAAKCNAFLLLRHLFSSSTRTTFSSFQSLHGLVAGFRSFFYSTWSSCSSYCSPFFSCSCSCSFCSCSWFCSSCSSSHMFAFNARQVRPAHGAYAGVVTGNTSKTDLWHATSLVVLLYGTEKIRFRSSCPA